LQKSAYKLKQNLGTVRGILMEARYRLGGVFCLLLAGTIGWQAIWQPLQEANLGADIVTWMPRATVIIGLCLVFGIYLLATGNRYPYRDVAADADAGRMGALCDNRHRRFGRFFRHGYDAALHGV
jgi:hypothetical protein